MFQTSELVPLLAERGVVLSREQVYRLVAKIPERLNLNVLAALCDILGCGPTELVEPVDPRPRQCQGGQCQGGLAPVGGVGREASPGQGRSRHPTVSHQSRGKASATRELVISRVREADPDYAGRPGRLPPSTPSLSSPAVLRSLGQALSGSPGALASRRPARGWQARRRAAPAWVGLARAHLCALRPLRPPLTASAEGGCALVAGPPARLRLHFLPSRQTGGRP